MYKKLILEVDAIDNGVSESENMRYTIGSGLASRIGRYNSAWNAPKTSNQHVQFKKAMKLAEEEMLWVLRDITQVKLPAKKVVQDAWNKRHEFHPSGEFIFFDTFAPWKESVFEIEERESKQGEIKFSISQD